MIVGVVGPNGAGKTAWAVAKARKLAKKKNVPIYANLAGDGITLVGSFDELLPLRNCIVILDEVLAVAGSREAQSLPASVQLWLTTLRHSNIALFWTSPAYDRADLILREVTREAVQIAPLFVTWPKSESLWPTTRYSFVITRKGGHDGPSGFPSVGMFHLTPLFGTFGSTDDANVLERRKFPTRCMVCGASLDYGRHKSDFSHVPELDAPLRELSHDYAPEQPHTHDDVLPRASSDLPELTAIVLETHQPPTL